MRFYERETVFERNVQMLKWIIICEGISAISIFCLKVRYSDQHQAHAFEYCQHF